MPVKVVKRSSKYRLVGPSGKVEKTKKGKPIDGGGHGTRAKALRQARAINAK